MINPIKQYASDAYRYATQDDARMINSLKEFYKAGAENPQLAKILMNDASSEYVRYLGDVAMDNTAFLRGSAKENTIQFLIKIFKGVINIEVANMKNEEIKPLYDTFQKAFYNEYPDTGKLRDQLIGRGRISFNNGVKPKLSWFKKLKLAKYL